MFEANNQDINNIYMKNIYMENISKFLMTHTFHIY